MDNIAVQVNGPRARALVAPGVDSCDAWRRIAAARGGACTRLPDGRLLFCGGAAAETASADSLNFTPPMLLAPQWTMEHAFDDEGCDYRASGPFHWTYAIAHDASTEAGMGASQWYHIVEHTVTALSDLRVLVFGGRSDPHRSASCHNNVRMADFFGDIAALSHHDELFVPCVREPKVAPKLKTETCRPSTGISKRTVSPQRSTAHRDELPPSFSFRGDAPTRRFAHSATLVGCGRLVMVAGGINERDTILSDMHWFLPFQAAVGAARNSGDAVAQGAAKSVPVGVWLKHGAECPRALRCLPQPAHHHRVVVLPSTTPPSADGQVTESWLLVADGKYLYRLTVVVRLPTALSQPTDGEPQLQACFDVVGDWGPVVGGGVWNVLPCRAGSAVTLLSDAVLMLHGGHRCLPSAPAARRADALRCEGRKGRLHRAVSVVGDLTDGAFLFNLRTLRWSYDAALTDALGYAAGHAVLPLSDGRPTHSRSMGRSSSAHNDDDFRTHYVVLGALAGPGNDTAPTLSTRDDPPTPPQHVLHAMVGRACSGVVRRAGCLMLGHLSKNDLDVSEDTWTSGIGEEERQPAKTHWQSPHREARRVSCTAQAIPPHHNRVDPLHDSAWASPAVVIRDTLLQQDVVDAAAAFKRHLQHCLTGVLRNTSDTALRQGYFQVWLAFVGRRRNDVDVQLAAQSTHVGELRKCCECNAAPCEVWLLPCRHFVLCGVCASGAIDCPACGTEVQGSEVACHGRLFPFLHGFLVDASDSLQTPLQQHRNSDSSGGGHDGGRRCDESGSGAQLTFDAEMQFSSLVKLPHRRRESNSTASPGAGPMTPSLGDFDYSELLGANYFTDGSCPPSMSRTQASAALQQRRADRRRTFNTGAAIRGRRSLRVASPMMF